VYLVSGGVGANVSELALAVTPFVDDSRGGVEIDATILRLESHVPAVE
jgi:hypothetical protein